MSKDDQLSFDFKNLGFTEADVIDIVKAATEAGILQSGLIASKPTQSATQSTSSANSPSPTVLPVPSPDKIILVSSTGTTHITSRALLCAHSSFFANLFTLPPPLTADNEPEPIPLPSATSAGLSLILAILDSLDVDGKFSPEAYKYWMKITIEDLVVIAEAAICADAYDIPVFETAFARPILSRMDHQPILEFALAAVTKYRGSLTQMARGTLTSRDQRPEIPCSIGPILKKYAPNEHDRLENLYHWYPTARHHLRQNLRSVHAIPNEEEGFSRRCYEKCSSYEYQKKWKVLRAQAAEKVYEGMLSNLREAPDCHFSIRILVTEVVTCSVCATRLAKTFARAVNEFLEVCDSY